MVEPVTLPCNHSICYICIMKIFQNNVACPLCREVPKAGFEIKVNTELKKRLRAIDVQAFMEVEK